MNGFVILIKNCVLALAFYKTILIIPNPLHFDKKRILVIKNIHRGINMSYCKTIPNKFIKKMAIKIIDEIALATNMNHHSIPNH